MEDTQTSDTLAQAAPVEAQAPETPAQDSQAVSSGTEAQERLLAGKYKSPEELEKGYKELEKNLGNHKKLENLVNAISEQTGMTPEQIEAELNARNSGQDTSVDTATSTVDPALKRTLQAQQAQLAKMQFAMEYKELVAENPAFDKVRGQLQELYMSKGSTTSLKELANEYYQPILGAVRDQVTQRITQQVASNAQTSQGSGPVVSNEAKRLGQQLSKQKHVTDDQAVQYLLAKKKQ